MDYRIFIRNLPINNFYRLLTLEIGLMSMIIITLQAKNEKKSID